VFVASKNGVDARDHGDKLSLPRAEEKVPESGGRLACDSL